MMFINNYCTDFMFQEVIVCVTCLPSIKSLIFFNFPLVLKISQKFIEFYVYRFKLKDKYPNFEVGLKCILMVNPYLLVCSYIK